MTSDTHANIRREPREARWPRTVRDAADRIAAEMTEGLGVEITGAYVFQIYNDVQEAILDDVGKVCVAGGRVPARASRLS